MAGFLSRILKLIKSQNTVVPQTKPTDNDESVVAELLELINKDDKSQNTAVSQTKPTDEEEAVVADTPELIYKDDKSPKGRGNTFKTATERVKDKAFAEIKQNYPSIPDDVVHSIVDNAATLSELGIYKMLRYSEVPYDTPRDEFLAAAKYGARDTDEIRVFDFQDWTWARESNRSIARYAADNGGYHLGLNVHVVPGLIQALDEVLARDAGRHISFYKFPKANFYDQVQYRHESVIIYTKDRDSATEMQIAEAVAPYARSNDGLLGELLGPGVDINPETTREEHLSVGQVAAVKIRKILGPALPINCAVFVSNLSKSNTQKS